MNFWNSRKVIVTGGHGFLGQYVVEKIRASGCQDIFSPRRKDYDLATEEAVQRLFQDVPCDIVIHVAGTVGGIGANLLHRGQYYYDNLVMGAMLMEHARRNGIEKFVTIGTTCSYPKGTPVPFREETLWDGYPDEPTAPYGLAKRMLHVQSQVYREQYGFDAIVLLPVNLYGPGDNFDLDTSHVVAAVIRKCWQAKLTGEREIALWGTGDATREFLFVEDAADGIRLATEHYHKSDPVNLGTGQEIRIRDLVHLVCEVMALNIKTVWDRSKPDGQPRRCVDTSRAKTEFGFQASTDLVEGLKKTIHWYTQYREHHPAVEEVVRTGA